MLFDASRGRLLSKALSDPAFPALKARVIARTGHQYYADKDELLFDRLAKRYKALSLPDAAAYLAHLDGADGREEWIALETEITIGETFFFRYAEQFAALRQHILPALIEARRGERRLRIWSAGCSTGAEPYSVAILLHELLGTDLADWDIRIIGTDISAAALATARDAEYGRWALRTMPTEERLRWFQPVPSRPGATREGGYRLRAKYREMVRFERGNLMELIEGGPSPAPANFDLVLCRNVLIYFSTEHVLRMMRAFSERLRPAGWLLIGHAEPNPAFEAWLAPVVLPGTIAYRGRGDADDIGTSHSTIGAAARLPATELGPAALEAHSVTPVIVAVAAEPPSEVQTEPPLAGPGTVRPRIETALSSIRALADAGNAGEAWRELGAAISADPTSAPLRYYEGLLACSLGRDAEAEQALRRALFLDRDFAMAHFHLGLLLAGRGRRAPAIRALDNAARLAQGLPSEALLPEGDGVSARDLAAMARHARDELGRKAR